MSRMMLLVFLCLSSAAYAKTYYVSTTGNNNWAGTLAAPWLTWEKAFNTVSAGDTVFFRGGIYYMNANDGDGYSLTADGTASDPICLFSFPNEVPILDGINITSKSGSEGAFGISAYQMNYVHIKGLTIRNIPQLDPLQQEVVAFSITESNNVIIENCTAYNTGGSGFKTTGQNIHFINCDSYNNCDSLTPAAGLPGNDGYGFTSYALSQATSIYYEGCRAWNCGDDGFGGINEGLNSYNNCWSFHNGLLEGEGNGFKLGWMETSSSSLRRLMTNCLSVYNGARGMTTNDGGDTPAAAMNIYNNTFYGNGWRGTWVGIAIKNTSSSNSNEYLRVFRNNICANNTGDDVSVDAGALYTHNNNSWDLSVNVSAADFVALPTDEEDCLAILSASRQADGSLPDIGAYFQLAPSSDLIDAGVNIGLPFNGSAPDLGYSENSGGTVTPPSPVYVGSVIENATPSRLELTYSLTLANIVPASSAFTVTVNSSTRTVTSVAVSGTKVLLTLSSPVVYGDVVTVAYTKPSVNPLQTASGGQAASINTQSVINNCSLVENLPPVISITSPTKSTSYTAPVNITIDASASDPDGSVVKIEFFSGTLKLGEITSNPYSFTWKNVIEGTYSITATATDNLNSKTVSAPVTVVVEKSASSVNQLPIVNVKTQGNSKKYKKDDTIILEVDAFDPDGTISSVQLKSGDVTLAEMTTPPYIYTLTDVDTGRYEIIAIATDNLGASNRSSILELVVVPLFDIYSEYITLYPNPNDGHFSVELSGSISSYDVNNIIISGLAGKRVYVGTYSEHQIQAEFDISTLAPGIYILTITSDNKIVAAKKFIKR